MKQINSKNIQFKLRNKFLKKGVKMIAPEIMVKTLNHLFSEKRSLIRSEGVIFLH